MVLDLKHAMQHGPQWDWIRCKLPCAAGSQVGLDLMQAALCCRVPSGIGFDASYVAGSRVDVCSSEHSEGSDRRPIGDFRRTKLT